MEWYDTALISLSEGICPDHGRALAVDGWCRQCGCWWSIRHDLDPDIGAPRVVTTYPAPRQAGDTP